MARVRYQALGPLMAGEGSRAFLGLEVRDDAEARPVALIWVPEDVLKDPLALSALQKETLRATHLIHPNILRVYDLARVEDGVARVVEFADGESLRSVLTAGKKLPAPFAALVATDAATGIYFAHEAGNDDGTPLVHGDLRPETVMVSFNGLSTVSGYGALSVAPRESGGKRVRGRRAHCAPEQLVGGREAVRPQTDVYLLGLSLYECLTGTVPFEDDADFDQAVLTKPFPLLESEDVPEALRPIIAKATAKKATDRYANALAFREAVEQAQPLPAREEFAAYLAGLFPASGEVRAARRRVIDAGIAEFARKQWADKKASGTSLVNPDVVAAPAAPPPPQRVSAVAPPPAVQPSPPPPQPPPAPPQPMPEEPRRGLGPIALGLALAAVAIGVVIIAFSQKAPPPPPPLLPVTPVVVRADASTAPDASTATDAAVQAQPSDGGSTADAGVSAADAGAAATVVPSNGETSLELIVDPPVDAEIDGQSAGHTPLTLPLAPGKHRVVLTDKRKGINSTRSVVVGAKGKTREEIHFGRGFVTVSAPAGAVVTFDGRAFGKAPLKGEVTLYEGPHQILVTVGKAKWQQSFNLRGSEHAYFNVEVQ